MEPTLSDDWWISELTEAYYAALEAGSSQARALDVAARLGAPSRVHGAWLTVVV